MAFKFCWVPRFTGNEKRMMAAWNNVYRRNLDGYFSPTITRNDGIVVNDNFVRYTPIPTNMGELFLIRTE